MGRLTRDPVLRATPGGTSVTDLGLAINRTFSSKEGDRKEETVFVEVVIWDKKAEVVCQYLKKGSPIFVEGRLSLDNWETPDGQKRSKMRVICENFQFLGRAPERGSTAPAPASAGAEETAGASEPAPDELPF